MDEERQTFKFGVRHLFVFLGFLGFANVYAMRVNLSVAIVYMAGSNKTGDSLGLEGEKTFGWSDKQQAGLSLVDNNGL